MRAQWCRFDTRLQQQTVIAYDGTVSHIEVWRAGERIVEPRLIPEELSLRLRCAVGGGKHSPYGFRKLA